MGQTQIPACLPLPIMIETLGKTFGETPKATMTTFSKVQLILFTSSSKETWTMIAVGQKGACILSSGTQFMEVEDAQEDFTQESSG